MTRRNENVRNACDEIKRIVENMVIFKLSTEDSIRCLNKIDMLTHRIKRTTWRGESKSQWSKDWDKYNNAKRINTNQTTTANIDVSTIPYY